MTAFTQLFGRERVALLFLALAAVLALAVTRARGLPPFQARPTEPASSATSATP